MDELSVISDINLQCRDTTDNSSGIAPADVLMSKIRTVTQLKSSIGNVSDAIYKCIVNVHVRLIETVESKPLEEFLDALQIDCRTVNDLCKKHEGKIVILED